MGAHPLRYFFSSLSPRRPGIFPSPLPPLYARWVDDLLTGPIPHETEATCDDCAMCAKEGRTLGDSHFFRPETKCCTYVPALPNFLVGGILAEEDAAMAAGRASVEERIRAGLGVTPLGVATPPVHRLLRESGGAVFGRAQALRCPHYRDEDGGRCGIWRHRNAVCATWFCKHVRGAVGMRFWQSLNRLLGTVETTLAHWCLLELGVGAATLTRLFPPPLEPGQPALLGAEAIDGIVEPVVYRGGWGDWHGREREFFLAAGRLVENLSWAQIVSIGGPEVRLCARMTMEAYTALTSQAIPERLVLGSFQAAPMGHHASRVISYAAYDPVALPKALMDVLPYFDGRPTRDVLRAIEQDTGLTLDRSLVRKLTDFEILVPAPEGA